MKLPEKAPQAWNDEDQNLLNDADFRLILQKCMKALPERWQLKMHTIRMNLERNSTCTTV